MGKRARFFMIKSSNEENIQKAREHSVWATTYANQVQNQSFRTNFAQLYCTVHMFSCSLPQTARTKSRDLLGWRRNQGKHQRRHSGQGLATYGWEGIFKSDGFASNH